MRGTSGGAKRLIVPIAVIALVAAAFVRASGAFFCAYDDFIELRQAAFEDTREPARVFTTPHFGSFKYRPVNRGLNLLTLWAGGDRPEFFRIRNLGFHLLNVLLLYGLALHLLRSPSVAAWAACLFGVHPLASVSVAGAVMTNTFAHAAALAALILFLASVREVRHRRLRVGACLVAAWVSVMAYDPDIVVLGLMAAYLALHVLARREPSIDGRLILAVSAIGAMIVGSYILLRAHFVPHGWVKAARSVPPVGIMAKNIVMYSLSLASPIDPVLANEVLNTPLPSEIRFGPMEVALAGALEVLILAALAWLVWRRARRGQIHAGHFDGVSAGFLLLAMVAPLVPVLVLMPHPSEVYLYLPVAFYLLLLVYGLHWLLDDRTSRRRRFVLRALVLALLALFAAATWVRNERLLRCGETADRIVAQLPRASLGEGTWKLWFANVPGEEQSRRYGCFGFRGTDTIGDGSNADDAMTAALQLRFSNDRLMGRVVDPEGFSRTCREPLAPRQMCLWVHADGRVEEWGRATGPR